MQTPNRFQYAENPVAQMQYLDFIASQEIPKVEITLTELEEKEAFRKLLESILKDAIAKEYSGDLATIDLVGFGSLASGFATPDSDVDLAIVPVWKEGSEKDHAEILKVIPRILEKAILDCNMGGRLLTRTRVPILKVCQLPSEALYTALCEERKKWDELPEEEKYAEPAPKPKDPPKPKPPVEADRSELQETTDHTDPSVAMQRMTLDSPGEDTKPPIREPDSTESPEPKPTGPDQPQEAAGKAKNDKHRERPWLREKVLGPLDFPKSGVGIQCDINFSNILGIHNTHLLRCYSACDPRVRPMVLFIKSWAKRRKINSSYSGTLSSYGWVLMVLHYLVNVVQPPVCPNLQLGWRPQPELQSPEQMFHGLEIDGYTVRFWRNEQEIMRAAYDGQLTRNTQTLGALLRGFFHYYANPPMYGIPYNQRPPQFHWTNEVLSLRTPGGILTKQEKGWTGAKTTNMAGKEVRHRYLFAIEDPFELDHNVARTVTHHGIVAIRDEFRRAWRILSAIGRNAQPEGGMFDEVVDEQAAPSPTPKDGQAAEESRSDMQSTGDVNPQPEQHVANNMQDRGAHGAYDKTKPQAQQPLANNMFNRGGYGAHRPQRRAGPHHTYPVPPKASKQPPPQSGPLFNDQDFPSLS
jgi:terminal uridylyltransferase